MVMVLWVVSVSLVVSLVTVYASKSSPLSRVGSRALAAASPDGATVSPTKSSPDSGSATPTGWITYASFATGDLYLRCQTTNMTWAKTIPEVGRLLSFSMNDLDDAFKRKNAHILQLPRGSGYWLWKPYIILKALAQMKEDEVLIYSDACSQCIDVVHLGERTREHQLAGYQLGTPQARWCKRDAFVLMDADNQANDMGPMRTATVIGVKNTPKARDFIQTWLRYAEDARILTDQPNEMGLPNHESFIENRHDQTVFSILTYQRGFGDFTEGTVKHHAVGYKQRQRAACQIT